MIPGSPLKLQSTLQQLFLRQAVDVVRRVTLDGPLPDLSFWVGEIAAAVKPIVLPIYQAGMIRAATGLGAKIARDIRARPVPVILGPVDQLLAQVSEESGFRRHEPGNEAIFGPRKGGDPKRCDLKAKIVPFDASTGTDLSSRWGDGPRWDSRTGFKLSSPQSYLTKTVHRLIRKAGGIVSPDFDPFSPYVVQAVDQMVFQFCKETNETATTELSEVMEKLRTVMAYMPRWEMANRDKAVKLLVRAVQRIFADPFRARRIAETEYTRAFHSGQLLAAKDTERTTGIKTRKSWLASADACPKCQELDGQEREHNKPFTIDPKGGPYAFCYNPPLHPYCGCDMEVIL